MGNKVSKLPQQKSPKGSKVAQSNEYELEVDEHGCPKNVIELAISTIIGS